MRSTTGYLRYAAIIFVPCFLLLYLVTDNWGPQGSAPSAIPIRTFGQRQEQASVSVRRPLYSGRYGVEALHNLSEWRSSLFLRTQAALAENKNEELGNGTRYSIFQEFVTCPPGKNLMRFGPPFTMHDDGGKSLCAPLGQVGADDSQPCVVYSFGSNGDFRFESDVLKNTLCDVYTFDCTYDGKSLGPRHHYLKMCLGSPPQAEVFSNIMSYMQIMNKFHHKRVEVAKVDIELGEWDVLAYFSEAQADLLPQQLAIEFHYLNFGDGKIFTPRVPAPATPQLFAQWNMMSERKAMGTSDIALLFGHLANLGYGIVHREINPVCAMCYEYVFLRVEQSGQGGRELPQQPSR